MKKLLLLALTVAMSYTAKSQRVTPPGDFVCSDYITYYPMGNDVVSVYVNFIFLAPSPGGGRYANLTATQAQELLDSLNYRMANILPPALVIPAPNTADYLSNAKIKFILKSVTHPVNVPSYTNLNNVLYAFPDTNAINMIYGTAINDCCGVGWASSNQVRLFTADSPPISTISTSGDVSMALHEVGHVLGLFHTDISPAGTPNPNGTYIDPGPLNDYWPEDANQFNQCMVSNNIMGYNCPRRYLSPKQIGTMHNTLRFDTPKRAVASYVSNPAGCVTVGGTWMNYSMGMDQTITSDPQWQGDVVIESGVHITISTCIRMPKGSRIIVEPKGKLSVINGSISGSPCGQWKGIEVQNNYGSQGVDPSTGMPYSVGMVELDNATISNAEIGVFLGVRNAGGAATSNGGGGIVYSRNTNYLNNRVHVQFAPYFVSPGGAPGNFDNMSYFKRDTFIVNEYYSDPFSHTAAMKLEKVKDVNVLGCYFSDVRKCNSKGIHCVNASVKLKDYCSSTFGTACIGTLTSNTFLGFVHGVYITTSGMFDFPSLIDHVTFDQDDIYTANQLYYFNGAFRTAPRLSHGAIYILNNTGTQISNCTFRTAYYDLPAGTPGPPPTVYSVYLDNCPMFTVENNNFFGDNYTSPITKSRGGLFINNCGPYVNNVYNNVFNYYTQALWTQNMNYDPATGTGLLLQCNDFFQNRYAIGVQNEFQGITCVNCPPPSQWAGISTIQGITTGAMTDLVRNNYSWAAGCAANYTENKYYINTTDNPFAVNMHGSFPAGYFQPDPQAGNCGSNASEITLANYSSPAPATKSLYCPVNNLPTFSSLVLNQNAGDIRNLIQALSLQYGQMDGGNTQTLLAMINDLTYGPDEVKAALLNPPFLSDQVMTAYFIRGNVNPDDMKEIFQRNAPVNPLVWAALSAKLKAWGIDPADMATWEVLQTQEALSQKNEIETQLVHARNELGLINNEKIRRFVNDTIRVEHDSIIAIYNHPDEFAWGQYRVVDALVAANRFDKAREAMANLPDADPGKPYFNTMQDLIIQLKSKEVLVENLREDATVFDYLMNVANSRNALVEGYAKGLLVEVYDYTPTELIYSPEGGSSDAKLGNNDEEQDTKNTSESRFSIFPNPASNQLTVTSEQAVSEMQLRIVNLTGQTMIDTECSSNCQIDISTLQAGIYFVNLYQLEELIGVKKLVVIR